MTGSNSIQLDTYILGSFIKNKLKSIDLNATNVTFVTKGKSYFLGTPTEGLKLNHPVNTKWNQLVIQFEPISSCT